MTVRVVIVTMGSYRTGVLRYGFGWFVSKTRGGTKVFVGDREGEVDIWVDLGDIKGVDEKE